MMIIIGFAAFLAAIAALAWWINVGSARRHWRQAEREARRQMLHSPAWPKPGEGPIPVYQPKAKP